MSYMHRLDRGVNVWENPRMLWYWGFVRLWWEEKLAKFHEWKSIQYSVIHVPWVPELVAISNRKKPWSWKKYETLWLRWIFAWDESSGVIIHPDVFNSAREVQDKIRFLWASTPDLIESSSQTIDIWGLPYWVFPNYLPKEEILLDNEKSLRNTEFFNDKFRFLKWLKENWLEELVPEWTKFVEGPLKATDYLMWVINDWTYFVKAWIWASWAWTWKVEDMESLKRFYEWSRDFSTHESIFDDDGNLSSLLRYDLNTWKWVGWRKKLMWFIIQPKISWEERSASYFLDDEWVYLVTETKNHACSNWTHEWNTECDLPIWVREKLTDMLKKVHEFWYRWPIGFDFFIHEQTQTVSILEANPRNTWATTPAMFTYLIKERISDILWWTDLSNISWRTWTKPLYDWKNPVIKDSTWNYVRIPYTPEMWWYAWVVDIWILK